MKRLTKDETAGIMLEAALRRIADLDITHPEDIAAHLIGSLESMSVMLEVLDEKGYVTWREDRTSNV